MSTQQPTDAHKVAFVKWLQERVLKDARGDETQRLLIKPSGRFWLGRLAPEIVVQQSRFGERAERLDPCEVGFRFMPNDPARSLECTITGHVWSEEQDLTSPWRKLPRITATVSITPDPSDGAVVSAGAGELSAAFTAAGAAGLTAEVRAECRDTDRGPEVVLTIVNTSPARVHGLDTTLYEVTLVARVGNYTPYLLEALPDSFRYDRAVLAYGVNGGVERIDGGFRTTDFVQHDQLRPAYWDSAVCGEAPDLSFHTLAVDPFPSLSALVAALAAWRAHHWSDVRLDARSKTEAWTPEMLSSAKEERDKFDQEVQRVVTGVGLLKTDPILLRAFTLANQSFEGIHGRKYPGWRPFQIGYLLAALPSIQLPTRAAEASVVDTLWFATGGGKTETYLGLLVTAAFYDRLMGKRHGITGWARFPLRMLSLQQTQRFANVFASAELVRQQEALDGDIFSVAFLVGPGTPNEVRRDPRPGDLKYRDPDEVAKQRVLMKCPFCGSSDLQMRFDETLWLLNHHCTGADCTWSGPLPFRIVDKEIFRFLPTVVVGTVDKIASLSMQAAMRGFYGPPAGICSIQGHGFTYAPRSKNPTGCLMEGCRAPILPLPQAPELFAPRYRLQDELHLLRDSLGAVATHYEALIDHLQSSHGSAAKVLASSATLAGYEQQVRSLYNRSGRLFPVPGPQQGVSFWSVQTESLARRYVGVAPRGVTMEFAADRTNEGLQRAVREALRDPASVAEDVGVPAAVLPALVALYGVQVTYGSTLRDVEAAARSFETEIPLQPVNAVSLTGRTPLDEVHSAIGRLEVPEDQFDDRIHLVAASGMLSHGVDIDRLNIMLMLGLPLSTAEFIQSTSRVGRTHPGLVIVMHKIGRERDAGVFRTFGPFVAHADRFVDPVPITRKSRRVLELTLPGLFLGRVLGIHEPAAVGRKLKPLTTVNNLRRAIQNLPILEDDEVDAIIDALAIRSALDESLREDVTDWMRVAFRELNDPARSAKFPSDLLPRGPMLSLRDVEQQAPVFSRGGDA